MIDNDSEELKKRISITDEFSELMLLRPDGLDADRDRVIGEVMQRIRVAPELAESESVFAAIGELFNPASTLVLAAAAALLVVGVRYASRGTSSVEISAPSTAQALGLTNGIARWSDQRDRAPQLLEVAADLSALGPRP